MKDLFGKRETEQVKTLPAGQSGVGLSASTLSSAWLVLLIRKALRALAAFGPQPEALSERPAWIKDGPERSRYALLRLGHSALLLPEPSFAHTARHTPRSLSASQETINRHLDPSHSTFFCFSPFTTHLKNIASGHLFLASETPPSARTFIPPPLWPRILLERIPDTAD